MAGLAPHVLLHARTHVPFLTQRDPDRKVAVQQIVQCQLIKQRQIRTVAVQLRRIQIVLQKTDRLFAHEGDTAPQTGTDQPGHDIPAEHIRRLAHPRTVIAVIEHRSGSGTAAPAPGLQHRRAQMDQQLVLAAAKRRCRHVLRDQHIFARADARAVEIDRPIRVHPLKQQIPAVDLSLISKSAVIPVVIALMGERLPDPAVGQRIVHQAGGHQIRLHIAGDGRRDRRQAEADQLCPTGRLRTERVILRVRAKGKFPPAVKIYPIDPFHQTVLPCRAGRRSRPAPGSRFVIFC